MGGVFLTTFGHQTAARDALLGLQNRGYSVMETDTDRFDVSRDGRNLIASISSDTPPEVVLFLTSASLNPIRLIRDRSLFTEVHAALAETATAADPPVGQ